MPTNIDKYKSDLEDLVELGNTMGLGLLLGPGPAEKHVKGGTRSAGDIRNLCDHHKDREPTQQEVEDLIKGVEKITKTLF